MNENACIGKREPMGTKTGVECLEAVTVMYVLAKNDFNFDSVSEFKNKTAWETAIANGDIVPMWQMYEFANANKEANIYETGNFRRETKKAVKVFETEMYLSLCSHGILASYGSGVYNKVFEITEDGYAIGVLKEGKVVPQTLSNLNVGIRNNATSDKVPNTKVTLTFADYKELERNPIMVEPGFSFLIDFDKVEELRVVYSTATPPSASVIEFTLESRCGESVLPDLKDDMQIFVNGAENPGVFTYDVATGVYTITAGSPDFVGSVLVKMDGISDSGDSLYASIGTNVVIA